VKCYCVHGVKTFDGGQGYVGQFATLLQQRGLVPELFSYSASWLFGFQWALNGGRARALAELIGNESCAVLAHSNGAQIAFQAAEMGAPIRNIVLLNPALDRRARLAAHVGRCDVFYTTDDPWTWISRWLPLHPWGDAGNAGYRGADERIVSWNMSKGIRRQAVARPELYPAEAIERVDGVAVLRETVNGFRGREFSPDRHTGLKILKDRAAWDFWAPLVADGCAGGLG
jgi:pimeloyl-ACP methyl ester carboxylesterase